MAASQQPTFSDTSINLQKLRLIPIKQLSIHGNFGTVFFSIFPNNIYDPSTQNQS